MGLDRRKLGGCETTFTGDPETAGSSSLCTFLLSSGDYTTSVLSPVVMEYGTIDTKQEGQLAMDGKL